MKLLWCLFAACLVGGCVSSQTVTTYFEDGKPVRVEQASERTPLIDKFVDISGFGYGFKIVLFDPATGSYSPCIEAIGGRTRLTTMPVIGEGDADTYYESLYIEKSLWSTNAAIVEYNRVSSGSGKQMKPSIKATLSLENAIPAAKTPSTVLDGVKPLIPAAPAIEE